MPVAPTCRARLVLVIMISLIVSNTAVCMKILLKQHKVFKNYRMSTLQPCKAIEPTPIAANSFTGDKYNNSCTGTIENHITKWIEFVNLSYNHAS